MESQVAEQKTDISQIPQEILAHHIFAPLLDKKENLYGSIKKLWSLKFVNKKFNKFITPQFVVSTLKSNDQLEQALVDSIWDSQLLELLIKGQEVRNELYDLTVMQAAQGSAKILEFVLKCFIERDGNDYYFKKLEEASKETYAERLAPKKFAIHGKQLKITTFMQGYISGWLSHLQVMKKQTKKN